MITVLKKEFFGFFNSLTAYVVIIVFLLINALLLWILPGDLNLLDYGYADLRAFFQIAPYTFMFLIPAVTMRFFADERKSGTLDLILSKPITELKIVMAKYLAALVLIIFSIIPTLIYAYTVYTLGYPKGNIDTGAVWGSYFGLLFLGACFVSLGLFASVITNNQILSFVIAIGLSAMFYLGFDYISSIFSTGNFSLALQNFGISSHYSSISRGVIDLRDIVYFLSLIILFNFLTSVILKGRK